MRNKFKSIATFVLTAVMLFNFSVPAMAAEQNPTMNETTVAAETADDEINLLATSPVAEFHYTGRLAEGKVLGTVSVSESCKTLSWTVGRTGSTGNVRFKLTNISTGATRKVTTTANNKLESITYISALSSGVWEISVEWNSNNWLYDLDLYFYEK